MNTIHPSASRRSFRTRGFTLIELMIAMILGLIVIAGVTSVFLAGQKSFRTNNALGEVEDSSRIAFELMARDIREAGLAGCDTASGRVSNVLNNSATAWWANWGNALHGYGGANSSGVDGDSDQTDPAVSTGTGVGDRVAGTDSLEVIGAANPPVTIASDQEPSGTITLNGTSATLNSGDLIIVCSPDHSTLLQVAAYDSGAKTVTHTTGGTLVPGNCSLGLGYPAVCSASGNTYSFPQNSSLAKVSAADWFIGNNAEGGTSLYRVSLLNTGGTTVSTQVQEMVRNVTDMQITYLQGNGTTFIPAASVTNWPAVTAARVTLTVSSTFQRASVKGDKPIVRTYSATTTVRNRVD